MEALPKIGWSRIEIVRILSLALPIASVTGDAVVGKNPFAFRLRPTEPFFLRLTLEDVREGICRRRFFVTTATREPKRKSEAEEQDESSHRAAPEPAAVRLIK